MEVDGPNHEEEEQQVDNSQPAVVPLVQPQVVQNPPINDGGEEDIEDETPWNGWPDQANLRRSLRSPKPSEKMKQYRAGCFEASLKGLFVLLSNNSGTIYLLIYVLYKMKIGRIAGKRLLLLIPYRKITEKPLNLLKLICGKQQSRMNINL